MRLPLFWILATIPFVSTVRADDGAAIKARLDKAKTAYEAESAQLNKDVIAEFDRRDGIARKAGDKEMVAQIMSERKSFDLDRDFPLNVPQALLEKRTAIRGRMTTAYKVAIKEYLVAKLDAEADATEKEMKTFWLGDWRSVELGTASLDEICVRMPKESSIVSKKQFSGPVEIVVMARTELHNIRIGAYRGSYVIFNWEQNVREFRAGRPDGDASRPESGSLIRARLTPLKPNVWYTVRWRLMETGMQVFLNGRLVYAERKQYDLSEKSPISVASGDSRIEVRAFHVIPLAPPEKD